MIRRVTAFLTVSAMLWHAIVGCCAHHMHVETIPDGVNHAQRETAAADAYGGCCTHSHEVAAVATEAETPNCPDHESECAEAKCVFVGARSDDASALADNWTQANFLGVGATQIVAGELDSLRLHSFRLASPADVPLRRHLALSVLRI
ncbi:hypothetical protein M4951_16210 [Blastopirellula sp. J2-11]|uniref:hypothetical protein n=1 Tax=Blastopirellula sp. J2-11 TaxID=2943192 RepID=UPI0021C84117|nr:hypothetical protein [Blastopirellula sp. J2-11]UUO04926.1 hypothetical protein M4951_16210 [Blastopirellula sp. J2-11]